MQANTEQLQTARKRAPTAKAIVQQTDFLGYGILQRIDANNEVFSSLLVQSVRLEGCLNAPQ
ncbi:MAG TPA: hypothetical protein V6D18_14610 [Thermosynechococcaceae cyanobacterium]